MSFCALIICHFGGGFVHSLRTTSSVVFNNAFSDTFSDAFSDILYALFYKSCLFYLIHLLSKFQMYMFP